MGAPAKAVGAIRGSAIAPFLRAAPERFAPLLSLAHVLYVKFKGRVLNTESISKKNGRGRGSDTIPPELCSLRGLGQVPGGRPFFFDTAG